MKKQFTIGILLGLTIFLVVAAVQNRQNSNQFDTSGGVLSWTNGAYGSNIISSESLSIYQTNVAGFPLFILFSTNTSGTIFRQEVSSGNVGTASTTTYTDDGTTAIQTLRLRSGGSLNPSVTVTGTDMAVVGNATALAATLGTHLATLNQVNTVATNATNFSLGGFVTTNLLYVSKSGSDSTGVRNRLDKQFLTINGARNAAQSGDVVMVFPGRYQEDIIAKSNVIFYLNPSVVLTNSTPGTALFRATNGGTFTVYGYGELTSDVKIVDHSSNVVLVCKSIVGQQLLEAVTNGTTFRITAESISCGAVGTIVGAEFASRGYIHCPTVLGGIGAGDTGATIDFYDCDFTHIEDAIDFGQVCTFHGGSVNLPSVATYYSTGVFRLLDTRIDTATADALISSNIVQGTFQTNSTGYLAYTNIISTGGITTRGLTNTGPFKHTTGATVNYVMTSDASGNGTWQAASGGTPAFGGQFGSVNGVTNFIGPLTNTTAKGLFAMDGGFTSNGGTNTGEFRTTTLTVSGASAFAEAYFSAPITASAGVDASGQTVTADNFNGLAITTGEIAVGGGTAVTKILTGTAVLNFPSTIAGAVADLTITVTGAEDGDTVSIGVPNGSIAANSSFFGWVSAADTVTVRLLPNGLTSDPASGTFRATVTKF